LNALKDIDAIVLAVPHREFLTDKPALLAKLKRDGILIDVKSAFDPGEVPSHFTYWSL
jgi:UDP-N-acetyl-D-galactosamine dehydrogenase